MNYHDPRVPFMVLREQPVVSPRVFLHNPNDAADLLIPRIGNLMQECAVVCGINHRNELVGVEFISVGTDRQTFMQARDVFRAAIGMNAAQIILAHNHPSGNATPSEEDVKTTKNLVFSGFILGIPVMDALVIGRPCDTADGPAKGWTSLRESVNPSMFEREYHGLKGW